jgi:hypothetical protein
MAWTIKTLGGRRVRRRKFAFENLRALSTLYDQWRGFGIRRPRGVFRFRTFEEDHEWLERTRTPYRLAPPTAEDVRRLCQALNAEGARYLVIGGIAVLYYGLARATEDIDLLVDPASDNIERIKRALAILPDRAAQDLQAGDVAHYSIVRIVDEITIGLISHVGDVTLETAEANPVELDDVVVPLASIQTLVATKQGLRERDKTDRAYLDRLLQSGTEEPSDRHRP